MVFEKKDGHVTVLFNLKYLHYIYELRVKQ